MLPKIEGGVEREFAAVQTAFAQNFIRGHEVGAGVCVIHKGRVVVDLWGGTASRSAGRAWNEDTLVPVFSCTKAAVAVCVHKLANQLVLDLDRPIAAYWPKFARHGKAAITPRMVLDHRAGVAGLADPLPPRAICDLERMVDLVADQRPLWEPGTRHGYHAMTFGWLLGGLVHQVTGMSVGEYLRREIFEPRRIDFFLGLPSTQVHRLAETTLGLGAGDRLSSRFGAALRSGMPIQRAVVNSLGDLLHPAAINEPELMSCEIPAVNGATNARGLASLLAPLASSGHDSSGPLVDRRELGEIGAVVSDPSRDAVFLEPSVFRSGFQKAPYYSERSALTPQTAFGHGGHGGSLAFADPGIGTAFGYATSHHLADEMAVARLRPVIVAVYDAVRSADSEKSAKREGADR